MTPRRRSAAAVAALGALTLALAARADAVTVTEFPLPVASSVPLGIAAGSDGNIWFVEVVGSRFGRVTPAGVVTDFSTGSGISTGARPWGIAAGPDGNLWFTEEMGNRVGRIVPAQAQATEFSAGISAGAGPRGIAAGPDGNVWFAEDAGRIGRITPAGAVAEFSAGISAGSRPLDIHAGPDGNLWFTEQADRIGRITTGGVVTEFSAGISAGSRPAGITAGPDGNLWFTEESGNRIGRITTAGAVTEFPLPTASSSPRSIVAGPDGNLWFTQEAAERLGRITTAGAVTEYPLALAGAGQPTEIAVGPSRDLWFTTAGGNSIARARLDPAATTGGASAVTTSGATLSGSVDPFSSATSFVVEYGRTAAYGSVTSSQTIPAGPAAVPVSVRVGGLASGTLHHYRVVASSAGGTTRGADRTFRTLGSPGQGGATTGPGDRIGPRMRIVGRVLRLTRGGRVRITLHCPLAETLGCRGRVRLETVARLGTRPAAAAARRRLRLGGAGFRIGGGVTRVITVRVSPRGRALARRRAGLPARAVVVAFDASDNRRTTVKRLLIRKA